MGKTVCLAYTLYLIIEFEALYISFLPPKSRGLAENPTIAGMGYYIQ